MSHQNDDREIPEFTARTWADVRDALRKALSENAREFRPIQPRDVEWRCPPCPTHTACALHGCAREMLQPVQLLRTPQPVSFLRWCGQPTVHSVHGRCDGVK